MVRRLFLHAIWKWLAEFYDKRESGSLQPESNVPKSYLRSPDYEVSSIEYILQMLHRLYFPYSYRLPVLLETNIFSLKS
jgi:hypothetical protein